MPARQLRALPEGHDGRLVALTGYGPEGDREKTAPRASTSTSPSRWPPQAVEALLARVPRGRITSRVASGSC
jgi:hypothetical protein